MGSTWRESCVGGKLDKKVQLLRFITQRVFLKLRRLCGKRRGETRRSKKVMRSENVDVIEVDGNEEEDHEEEERHEYYFYDSPSEDKTFFIFIVFFRGVQFFVDFAIFFKM